MQAKLWVLSERIARAIETPEHKRKRLQAGGAAAEFGSGVGAAAGTDGSLGDSTGPRESPLVEVVGGLGGAGQISGEADISMELEPGKELDELAVKCVGALSLMLQSEQAKKVFTGPAYQNGLEILLELATAAQNG